MYYKYYRYDDDDNLLKYIQEKYNLNSVNKYLFSTLVASHDNWGQRGIISDEVEKYGEIKYAGKFRNNTKIGKRTEDKIEYISKGVFNICPENSKSEGYWTEKIFQAFEAGTIPIYWGEGIPEPKIINENKYCLCNLGDIQKSISDVMNNKESYIKGPLFKDTAIEEMKQLYSDLKNSLTNLLK